MAATESGVVGYRVAVTTISASLVVSAGSWAARAAGTRPRQATVARREANHGVLLSADEGGRRESAEDGPETKAPILG